MIRIYILILVLAFIGCKREYRHVYYIDVESPDINDSNEGYIDLSFEAFITGINNQDYGMDQYTVLFTKDNENITSGQIEQIEQNVTKSDDENKDKDKEDVFIASEPIQLNRYTHIFVYDENDNPINNNYIAMGVYECQKVGTLTSVSYPITMYAGVYNLYSAGADFIGTDQGPNFTNGMSTTLYQDVAYIWWHEENVNITESDQEIPINYERCCAQIVINFSGVEGYTDITLYQVDISLGNPGECSMNLATGVISPSTELSNGQTLMHIDGLSTSVVTLPLKPALGTELTCIINAKVNDTNTWFKLMVPLPSGSNAFEAGNSYVYSAVFNEASLTTTSKLKEPVVIKYDDPE